MPVRFARPTLTYQIVEAAAFDLSDTDAGGGATSRIEPLDAARADRAPRADKAADVLALCALWVFQDRRRRRAYGASACALPGL